MGKQIIKALVEGGKASPKPPLGPQLSQLKLDVKKVIAEINEKTKDFAGMQVPVEIIVNEDKTFEIKVGTPPVSSLVKKELGVQKLAKEPGREVVGDLKFEQVLKITKMKIESLGTRDMKKAVKQILGSLVSMGVTVEGKHPKEIQKEIDEGKWDEKFK
ncbi:MAG TPA: 50S ribosomal protein L11 [Nanoarchaeota archaeon]|nr:50S ribosomal protein L11 [Nanoarchaeota archaeon]